MKEIKARQGQIILVDDDDYERIKGLKVKVYRNTPTVHIEGKMFTLHKLILNDSDKKSEYVFKDGNRLNLQKENIVRANRKEMSHYNILPIGNSLYKGVSTRKDKPGAYECRIVRDNKTIRIGRYINEVAAANAYNHYAKQYHGDNAYINDVPYMSIEECEKYLCKNNPRVKPKKVIENVHCKLCNSLISHHAKQARIEKQCPECTSKIKRQLSEAKKQELLLQREIKNKQLAEQRKLRKIQKENEILARGYRECKKCKTVKSLDNFTESNKISGLCIDCVKEYSSKWYEENREHIFEIGAEWRKNNARHMREYRSIRHKYERTRKKNLEFDLTPTQWKIILESFDNKCALTGSEDIHMEHFIPLSWHHGGTHIGNVYPLDGMLNSDKRDENPFEWIKRQDHVDQKRWKFLIDYLAAVNGLESEEFKEYVYWCERNKRTLDQVVQDGDKTSLELFKESCYSQVI